MNTKSDFICQVVLVTNVEPHPYADKLDLVAISLDGEADFPQKIISAKSELRPRDRMVYVGPDSIVPLSGPFEFLKGRLDAKGKTHYRVRSAKLRGLYSPGLLVRLPDGDASPVGTEMAEKLGVTNYDTDAHLSTGNGGAANTVVPKLRVPDLYPVYGVYSLKKTPDLFQPGELVHVTEKLHGTNFRFGYGGKRNFYYGTHRTNLSDNRGLLARVWDFVTRRNRVNSNPGFNNPWSEAVARFDLKNICKDARDYIFYGELFGRTANGAEVQKGFSYGFNNLELRIFDVYNAAQKTWLNCSDRLGIVGGIGLGPVPPVGYGAGLLGTVGFDEEEIKGWAEDDSVFGGIREGVVVESATDATKKAKWVSQRYHLGKYDN